MNASKAPQLPLLRGYMTTYGWEYEDLARVLGKSKSYVYRRLRDGFDWTVGDIQLFAKAAKKTEAEAYEIMTKQKV